MRPRDPRLQDLLAAEYVLGAMSARTRARFASLLRYDPRLRRMVSDWEARLAPLAATAAEQQPPHHVWQALQERIARRREARHAVNVLAWWRAAAATFFVAALSLALVLGNQMRQEPPAAMIAVLNDDAAQPAMTVSWARQKSAEKRIRVKVVSHPGMPAGTDWELWMIPEGQAKPISLGIVNTTTEQMVAIPAVHGGGLSHAWGFAVSVEPKGGSPTGQPTGPVMFRGRCLSIL